jgi:FkbM family methyltransferase
MIEANDVKIHIDPRGDRIEKRDFVIDGWIAAHEPIKAVWLPASSTNPLPVCERPDVARVFPGRETIGFTAKCSNHDVGPNGLRIAIQVGESAFEVQHPLPAPLPARSKIQQLFSNLRLKFLELRERAATSPAQRWNATLRRHLLLRKQRANIFRRAHADALLSDFAKAVPEAMFLQIGANDGMTGDPIRHLIARPEVRWDGVMVEPVAHLFAELSQHHANNPDIKLEQVAIGETDGIALIYRLNTTSDDSRWLDQLPSLDRTTLQRTAAQLGASEERIIAENVNCLRVETLLTRNRISQLDLLVIDTEGWDWRVLRQFDLDRLRPKIILYEHQHLGNEERQSARQFLARHNYSCEEMPEGDAIAWRFASKADS